MYFAIRYVSCGNYVTPLGIFLRKRALHNYKTYSQQVQVPKAAMKSGFFVFALFGVDLHIFHKFVLFIRMYAVHCSKVGVTQLQH